VSAPGFQLAGQTSPCVSVNWNACTSLRVSSTDRPTGKSFIVICLNVPFVSMMNNPLFKDNTTFIHVDCCEFCFSFFLQLKNLNTFQKLLYTSKCIARSIDSDSLLFWKFLLHTQVNVSIQMFIMVNKNHYEKSLWSKIFKLNIQTVDIQLKFLFQANVKHDISCKYTVQQTFSQKILRFILSFSLTIIVS
jgi:hypothetical protein